MNYGGLFGRMLRRSIVFYTGDLCRKQGIGCILWKNKVQVTAIVSASTYTLASGPDISKDFDDGGDLDDSLARQTLLWLRFNNPRK